MIPRDKLEKQARKIFDAAKAKDPSLKEELYRDLLLLELKEWFKTDFFSWVDSPPCPSCGGPTQSCGMGVATAQEREDGAGRVEMYKCDKCRMENIRFARWEEVVMVRVVTVLNSTMAECDGGGNVGHLAWRGCIACTSGCLCWR